MAMGRILIAAACGFHEDGCSAKASALTFYSLLSIVPVLAVAFGIAKGFGFEKHLEAQVSQQFLEQREITDKLIAFAYNTLQNAQSGLIAGVGLVVLFWAVLKLFGNIESSFNAIWKVRKPRSFVRSFSDYLAMMLFCPIFFAASSSLSVFVVTQIVHFSQEKGIWQTVGPLMYVAFNLFPLMLAWLLFTALYAVMPNTKVPLRYALLAGVCAGTAYQIVQAVYIHFQVGLASYGAIYGSFAAVPLFLLWLNASWMIALAGAEIAYHAENDQVYAVLSKAESQREADVRVLGLLIMRYCIRAFYEGSPPSSIDTLSQRTGASTVIVREVVHQLTDAGLLIDVNWHGSGEYFVPARAIHMISVKSVCDALDSARHRRYWIVDDADVKHYEDILKILDQLVADSNLNPLVVEPADKEL